MDSPAYTPEEIALARRIADEFIGPLKGSHGVQRHLDHKLAREARKAIRSIPAKDVVNADIPAKERG